MFIIKRSIYYPRKNNHVFFEYRWDKPVVIGAQNIDSISSICAAAETGKLVSERF